MAQRLPPVPQSRGAVTDHGARAWGSHAVISAFQGKSATKYLGRQSRQAARLSSLGVGPGCQALNTVLGLWGSGSAES